MEGVQDVVPEMIYSLMMDFERIFLCQMCNKILLLKMFIERNKKKLDGFRYLMSGILCRY
jgi:hypothetical protein